jgi:hypothetical protein
LFTGSGSVASIRMHGTMLWFNAAKDLGALRTEDGERIDVPGEAFVPDAKPRGRCAGMAIVFDSVDGAVSSIAFVEELPARRARLRRHR